MTRAEAESWLRASAAATYELMSPAARDGIVPLFTHLLETLRLRGPRAVQKLAEQEFRTWRRVMRQTNWPVMAEGYRRRLAFVWAVRRIMQATP